MPAPGWYQRTRWLAIAITASTSGLVTAAFVKVRERPCRSLVRALQIGRHSLAVVSEGQVLLRCPMSGKYQDIGLTYVPWDAPVDACGLTPFTTYETEAEANAVVSAEALAVWHEIGTTLDLSGSDRALLIALPPSACRVWYRRPWELFRPEPRGRVFFVFGRTGQGLWEETPRQVRVIPAGQ